MLEVAEKVGVVLVGNLNVCKDLAEANELFRLCGREGGERIDLSVVVGVQRHTLQCCLNESISAELESYCPYQAARVIISFLPTQTTTSSTS